MCSDSDTCLIAVRLLCTMQSCTPSADSDMVTKSLHTVKIKWRIIVKVMSIALKPEATVVWKCLHVPNRLHERMEHNITTEKIIEME